MDTTQAVTAGQAIKVAREKILAAIASLAAGDITTAEADEMILQARYEQARAVGKPGC